MDKRLFLARRSRQGILPRTLTVQHVISNFVALHGIIPTDQEVAALLACNVSKIRKHRALIEENT